MRCKGQPSRMIVGTQRRSTAAFRNHAGDGRCTARSKRTGERCKRRVASAPWVCCMHGGKTPVGPGSPSWKSGKFSTRVPRDLLEAYERVFDDEVLLGLRHSRALLLSRLDELMRIVDGGSGVHSAEVMGQVRRTWMELAPHLPRLLKKGNVGNTHPSVSRMNDLMKDLTQVEDNWREAFELIDEYSKIGERESRVIARSSESMSKAEAAALVGFLAASVRRHIKDPEILRKISKDLQKSLGEGAEP